MKEFYGNASMVVNFNFNIKSKNIEEAKEKVLGADGMVLEIFTEEAEKLEIEVQDWNIPKEVGRGNVIQSGLSNFCIEEEK